jgi:hypothetical protein
VEVFPLIVEPFLLALDVTPQGYASLAGERMRPSHLPVSTRVKRKRQVDLDRRQPRHGRKVQGVERRPSA